MKLPFVYFKADPTQFARISSKNGKSVEGKGLAKLVMPSFVNIELIQLGEREVPFAYTERTSDNQQIKISGSLTYTIEEPSKTMNLFNFSIDPKTKLYTSNGVDMFQDSLVKTIGGLVRKNVQEGKLEDLLVAGDKIKDSVRSGFEKDDRTSNLGIKYSGLEIFNPTTDKAIEDALGAEYKEKVLTKQQNEQYERRKDGVAQEKKIADQELQNREDLAKKLKQVLEAERENELSKAKIESEVLDELLKPFSEINPELLRAIGLYKMGDNAKKLTSLSLGTQIIGE